MDLVVQGPALTSADIAAIAALADPQGIHALAAGSAPAYRLTGIAREAGVAEHCAAAGIDCAFVPRDLVRDRVRVVAMDMDSTLITIECIDEIAGRLGIKAEVAAITASAMRGEIDFTESLERRVALLSGLPVGELERVYDDLVRFSPGAERMLEAFRTAGAKTLLVSGGFTFFSDRIRDRLHIDDTRSNVLEIVDGRLTGRMVDQPWGDICDGAEKRRAVLETCARFAIDPARAIAVGDGANDLPMMEAVGLSVAYHAKPAVRARAMVSIVEGGMDRLLDVVRP